MRENREAQSLSVVETPRAGGRGDEPAQFRAEVGMTGWRCRVFLVVKVVKEELYPFVLSKARIIIR
jgi:hypothetical protein